METTVCLPLGAVQSAYFSSHSLFVYSTYVNNLFIHTEAWRSCFSPDCATWPQTWALWHAQEIKLSVKYMHKSTTTTLLTAFIFLRMISCYFLVFYLDVSVSNVDGMQVAYGFSYTFHDVGGLWVKRKWREMTWTWWSSIIHSAAHFESVKVIILYIFRKSKPVFDCILWWHSMYLQLFLSPINLDRFSWLIN